MRAKKNTYFILTFELLLIGQKKDRKVYDALYLLSPSKGFRVYLKF